MSKRKRTIKQSEIEELKNIKPLPPERWGELLPPGFTDVKTEVRGDKVIITGRVKSRSQVILYDED